MAIVMSTAGACLSCLPAGLHSDAVPAWNRPDRNAVGVGGWNRRLLSSLVCWVRAAMFQPRQATSCSTRRSIFRSIGRKRVDWRVDCPRPKRWRRARRKGEAKRRESRTRASVENTSTRPPPASAIPGITTCVGPDGRAGGLRWIKKAAGHWIGWEPRGCFLSVWVSSALAKLLQRCVKIGSGRKIVFIPPSGVEASLDSAFVRRAASCIVEWLTNDNGCTSDLRPHDAGKGCRVSVLRPLPGLAVLSTGEYLQTGIK